MAVFPVRATINGTVYDDQVLDGISITYGHTDVYEQSRAPYCKFSIISGANTIKLLPGATVLVEAEDSTSVWRKLFTGKATDISRYQLGDSHFGVDVIAVGTLGQVNVAPFSGASLPLQKDGDRVESFLIQALNYRPIDGLIGDIDDQPGTIDNWFDYDLDVINASPDMEFAAEVFPVGNALQNATNFASMSLGSIVENRDGTLSYRPQNYVNLATTRNFDSDEILDNVTVYSDLNNFVNTIEVTSPSVNRVIATGDSVATYGVSTATLETEVIGDRPSRMAIDWLAYLDFPYPRIEQVSFLTAPLNATSTNYLINMLQYNRVSLDLPAGLYDEGAPGTTSRFEGIVAGWSWDISKTQQICTLNLLRTP